MCILYESIFIELKSNQNQPVVREVKTVVNSGDGRLMTRITRGGSGVLCIGYGGVFILYKFTELYTVELCFSGHTYVIPQ